MFNSQQWTCKYVYANKLFDLTISTAVPMGYMCLAQRCSNILLLNKRKKIMNQRCMGSKYGRTWMADE